jgi:PAS domain S-box-containing protein
MGAVDFVRRDDPVHLAYSIRRALKEKRMLDDRHTLLSTFKETEEHYRSIMGNLPVGIFRTTMSVPGRFLQANTFASRMFGFSNVEDMLKNSPSDLYADPSEHESLIREIMELGFLKGKEIHFKTMNGRIIWCSLTASCHHNVEGEPDWLEGLLEDITEKKEADENIRTNYRFLQTLIDTISSPLFYKDINGIYLGCNRAFSEAIAGLPGEEIIGRTVFDILESDFAGKSDSKDRYLIKNPGTQVYEESIICVDGKLHNFQFNKSTYTGSDGEVAGIVGVMLDITERVETESALIKLNEEMDLVLSSIANYNRVSVEDVHALELLC